mmetsp:Transcript_11394/g.18047  ORF Transcript_11394/g.18047 Transcript_11394/m.18047 type:complete len:217 (+) Transcript_11394:387-1037(+)
MCAEGEKLVGHARELARRAHAQTHGSRVGVGLPKRHDGKVHFSYLRWLGCLDRSLDHVSQASGVQRLQHLVEHRGGVVGVGEIVVGRDDARAALVFEHSLFGLGGPAALDIHELGSKSHTQLQQLHHLTLRALKGAALAFGAHGPDNGKSRDAPQRRILGTDCRVRSQIWGKEVDAKLERVGALFDLCHVVRGSAHVAVGEGDGDGVLENRGRGAA